MAIKPVKRFIAGAVCPRCAEMDKLVMFKNEEEQQVRECVRCGYSDKITEDGTIITDAEELSTRVNQPRVGEQALPHEDEVQVVYIVDAGLKRRDH